MNKDNTDAQCLFYVIVLRGELSPSRRRRREAPCEGTNSPRLFTPGETKALAESKVLSSSNIAGVGDQPWVVILTDLKYMADCHE